MIVVFSIRSFGWIELKKGVAIRQTLSFDETIFIGH